MFLKQGCPTAYTYPYDDSTSTFTCRSPGAINEVGYTITFGSLKAPSKCATTSATASILAASGDEGSACTAFLSRAVGYRGSLRAGARWNAPLLTIADWIETAPFSIGRPRGVIVRESSPDDVVWLSYPLARRRGTPERTRRGIVASDELGTHVLDALHAERLLVPTGATSGDIVPAVPQAGLFDSYKCYRLKPSAGAARPRLVSATYTDDTGPQQVVIRDFPDSLCTEADLGEGVGHELAQVACYRIRSDRGDVTRPVVPGHGGSGRLPITSVPLADGKVDLTVSNRFGTASAERGGPEEICVPIEVTDRGQ